jgi:probable F420-dependent oxidoreductase
MQRSCHAAAVARALRFCTQAGAAKSGAEWIDRAKRLEALGYSALLIPDHVIGTQLWSVFPALTAAAVATTKLRVGTLVIANDFRNPLLLAREFATLDLISDGRAEIGLGAGWATRDYESLGIPYDRGRVRVERLAESVRVMKRLFTEEKVTHEGAYYQLKEAQVAPAAVQKPHPPIHIAGGGRQILTLAGQEADIVAIIAMVGGAGQVRDRREMTADASVEKIGWVREAAGDRFDQIELSMFLDVTLSDDPEATVRDLAKQLDRPAEQITESAYRVIGSIEDVRKRILEMRELGFTNFCLRGPNVEDLGPLVGEMAGT